MTSARPAPAAAPASTQAPAVPVIVYVDDADQARQLLAPLRAGAGPSGTHWVLVACAPRMTHRISKWVSHRARESWRDKWADKLFAGLVPWLRADGSGVTTVLAKGPLGELCGQLQAQFGAARVVDARRPRLEDVGMAGAPVVPAAARGRLSLPGTLSSLLAGLGVLLVLELE